MSIDPDTQPISPSVEQFWKRYIDVLKLFHIPERSRPWYRKHVQEFIDAHPGAKLRTQTPEAIEHWFAKQGLNPQLSAWQLRQKVDALRLLFRQMLKSGWASEFDWDHWAEGGQPLSDRHPTVARSYETTNAGADRPGNLLGNAFPKVYARFIAAIRVADLAINTEQSYLGWINRFLRFHKSSLPEDCAEQEVSSFLEHLAVRRKVSGATQAQALNALVFFYARVLEKPLGDIGTFKRPKPYKRIPTVLSRREVAQILARTQGMSGLMVRLMYGTGMRVMECARLRILDLDFDYRQITVRAGKGKKDRVVPMPDALAGHLKRHIAWVTDKHAEDLKAGFGAVYLPEALERKYPNAAKECSDGSICFRPLALLPILDQAYYADIISTSR